MADSPGTWQAVVLLTLVALGGVGSADMTAWQPAGADDWFSIGSWDLRVPTSSDTAVVGNGGTAQVGAGAAEALTLEVGAALESTQSGTVTVSGGSLTAATVRVGTATSNTADVVAGGTGTLDMFDAIFLAPALLEVGVSSTSNSNGAEATSTGQATLSGGTATVADLRVGNATANRGQATASGDLLLEGVAFTGTGTWTIGAANKPSEGGSATVSQASVVIEGDDTSTADLTGLTVGSSSASYGPASTSASLAFTGQNVTTTNLSVGTAHSGESGWAGVDTASATFDADLTVTGNANVGTGSSDNSITISNASLTVEAGHVFDVGGALTVGSGGIGRHADLSIVNPAVALGTGVDFSVDGLLTIGQIYSNTFDSGSVDDAHLTLDGGSASMGGGLTVGQTTVVSGGDVGVSGRLALEGTAISGSGAWTLGEAILRSYDGPVATVAAGADVAIAGTAGSAVNLSSVTVGHALSEEESSTVSATADLSLSGIAVSVGGLQVGTASATRKAGNATVAATARLEETTFAGAGAWTIGSTSKAGQDGSVGAATVNKAEVVIDGDDSSTADLDGLSVGTATANYGTAQTNNASLSFAGQSMTTTSLSVGTAGGGRGGIARVDGASATFDADLMVTGDATIGAGSASSDRGSQATVQNVGLTVKAGNAFDVGGALVIGSASSASEATATVTGPGVTLAEGVDFTVGGLLTVGQVHASGYRDATVTNAHLTLQGGSASLDGGLAVGLASTRYVGDAGVTASLLLDETSFSGHGAWTIGEAIASSGSHRDAIVNSAEVRILGDATSNADLSSVTVGHAQAHGDGLAQTTASLTYRGGAFQSAAGMDIGWAEADHESAVAQATGSATFQNASVGAPSLRIGHYSGTGEEDASGFAEGSVALVDSTVTVTGDVEVAHAAGGAGSAAGTLSLTRSLLDIGGDLLLDEGSELHFEVDSFVRGLGYGAIDARAAQLNGDLSVAFNFSLIGSGYWDLITLDAGAIFASDFDSVEVLGLSSEAAWSLGFATDHYGQAVYRLAVTGASPDPVSVPAPGAIGLVGVGLGVLSARRRRR